AANRAKDEFLAVLSHELRTPLTAMLGWIALLRPGRLPADRTRYALDVIERNARMQAQLINDLLDVSRIVAGKMEFDRSSVDRAGHRARRAAARVRAVPAGREQQPPPSRGPRARPRHRAPPGRDARGDGARRERSRRRRHLHGGAAAAGDLATAGDAGRRRAAR